MGGDQAPNTISWLAKCVKEDYPKLKVAWYSGKQEIDQNLYTEYFDYIKLGPYIENLGPLNSPTTNQRLDSYSKFFSDHSILGKGWWDITYKFWKK